jgi:Tol biopolymer transport system component
LILFSLRVVQADFQEGTALSATTSPKGALVHSRIALAALLVVLPLSSVAGLAEPKIDKLPRLPGATLLVGYPPGELVVTTGTATLTVQSNRSQHWNVHPSISADGRLVASARVADEASALQGRPLLIVGIYSTTNNKWTDTPLKFQGGSVALSPEGSRLASIGAELGVGTRLQVMDLRDGTVKTGPTLNDEAQALSVSWSPDGRSLVFEAASEVVYGSQIPPIQELFVMDVESGTTRKLAEGRAASWSPSGEWIAFCDYEPGREDVKHHYYARNANRVSLIRPNGTEHRTLVTFGKYAWPFGPVWSPDSTELLISRPNDSTWDWEPKVTIYMLDLATGKLEKRFTKAPPVYAWLKAN